MARPKTREELLHAAEHEYRSLQLEVSSSDRRDLEVGGVCELWSIKDLLAHLDAWHELFLRWERIGSQGGKPEMLSPGMTWRDTPALNEQIWKRTKHDPYADVAARLDRSFKEVREVIASYSNDELFDKKRYSWTGSTSVGSYAISATSSHYAWARKLVARFNRGRVS